MAKSLKKVKQKVLGKSDAPNPPPAEPIAVDPPSSEIVVATSEAPDGIQGREAVSRSEGQPGIPGGLDGDWNTEQSAVADDSDWGAGAADSADMWGGTGHISPVDEGGGMDWGMPTGLPVVGWGEQAMPSPQPTSGQKGGNKKGRVPAAPPPPPPPIVRGSPAAFQAWGNLAGAWGTPTNVIESGWDAPMPQAPPPPPLPPPPMSNAAGPAPTPGGWKNWGQEAKALPKVNLPTHSPRSSLFAPPSGVGSQERRLMSPEQQSKRLRSLLTHPVQSQGSVPIPQFPPGMDPRRQQQATMHQQSSAALPRHLQAQREQQQSHHPQQDQLAQLRAQLEFTQRQQQQPGGGNMGMPGFPQSQVPRAPPIQQSTSWGSTAYGGYGTEAIAEEDEEGDYYDEDEEAEDEEDDYNRGYSAQNGQNGQRVRFSPTVSYLTETPSITRAPSHGTSRGPAPFTPVPPFMQPPPQATIPPSFWGDTVASKTMAMATGRSTAVFELVPPRNGMGENQFIESHDQALIPAQRALFSRSRPAKERVHWGFNPDKDERVSSLLRWVLAMSNGLATIGLQKFLMTRQRGALISNADYRVNDPGQPAQPAFDWITMGTLNSTLDRVLQESVALYDPAKQVIVYVFLLSKTGNSMAVWRRKLAVPEGLRQAYAAQIDAAKAQLAPDYPVYVEELPVKEETPAELPTKKPNKLSKFKWFKRKRDKEAEKAQAETEAAAG